MLTIFEALFLLALDDEKGIIHSSAKKIIPFGLSGAILAELALRGKVCATEKSRLQVVDGTPTGDEVLDEALAEIQSSEKLRRLTYWVDELNERPKKIRERLGERLVASGVLYQDEKYLFQAQPSEESQAAGTLKFQMKQQLRAMVLSDQEVDLNSLVLLGMARAGELLHLIFTPDELLAAKRHIHELTLRETMQNPALETIEEIARAVVSTVEDGDE